MNRDGLSYLHRDPDLAMHVPASNSLIQCQLFSRATVIPMISPVYICGRWYKCLAHSTLLSAIWYGYLTFRTPSRIA